MEKVLLILAIAFAILAISSRHRLHKTMDEGQSQSIDLKGDEQNPQSLTYALSKMTTVTNTPPAPTPTMVPKKVEEPPPQSHEQLVEQVRKLVDAIQISNQDSPEAFEKALNLTSGPENLALRLTIFQAAQNMQVDSPIARNLALRETTSLIVAPVSNNENPTPEEASLRDLQRNTVIAAYKVYVQGAQDQDVAFNDVSQALSFQTDQWVRRQLIFETVAKFPQLRERLNE